MNLIDNKTNEIEGNIDIRDINKSTEDSQESGFVSSSSKSNEECTGKTNVSEQSSHQIKNNNQKSFNKPGRYTFLKTIGRGNFAKVKLAKHLSTNRQVAIKIIDKTQLKPKALEMINREVSLMKELSHPNITKLLEVMETEKTLYLVLEYADGGDLFDRIVLRGRMCEDVARQAFRKMLSAIHYCHNKSIAHRDIKAENILLHDKGKIKIADFGFSNTFSHESVLNTHCGSPHYAAPEIYKGEDYVGPEVDVWALGVTLFLMVSGRMPFAENRHSNIRNTVTNIRYEMPRFISMDCKNLLSRIFVTANERLSLDSIIDHPWVNAGGLPRLMSYGKNVLTLCPQRVKILKEMGYLQSDIEDTFTLRHFNNIHATYHLLKSTDSFTQFLKKTRHSSTTKNTSNGANQQAIMSAFNQLSAIKRQKAMFPTAIGEPLSTAQMMEANQRSAPPILLNAEKPYKSNVESITNKGKFTVNSIQVEPIDGTSTKSNGSHGQEKFRTKKSIISKMKNLFGDCIFAMTRRHRWS